MRTAVLGICLIVLINMSCTMLGLKQRKYDYSNMDRATRLAHYRVEKFLNGCIDDKFPVPASRFTRIDSVKIDYERDHINIYFNRFMAHLPYREDNLQAFYDELEYMLGRRFGAYSVSAYSRIFPLETLVPNYYRKTKLARDTSRMALLHQRPKPVVQRMSVAGNPASGLFERNIALWHSHGWYYEQKLNRWEWQRARLFQTVEDLGPMAFTIPYLIPMLENAGANVFVPRERDVQSHEVIIDNDSLPAGSGFYREEPKPWPVGSGPGFSPGFAPYSAGENPFTLGSYTQMSSDPKESHRIEWIPDIPEDGSYAVYVSYAASDSNISNARYTVYHSGGKTDFLINQKIAGSTWIYLDHFKFKKGLHPDHGKVVLTNQSSDKGYVTADAVRFGGGMGDVERGGTISGRPRFTEGARYYMQYAGMPDTLVFSFYNEQNDYRDDYTSRGEWVNYLMGNPFGPNKQRDVKGLGIPIDLSLAFHTDAGISRNDVVIGTLSIYSSWDADSAQTFPDGVSRLANRDFADIMQTQIVADLRKIYDPHWNRRGLWDRQYSEAFRPNTPAALLELLSHQNFLDMQFALDPRFRFDVSRAIYKSMLRFIADRNNEEYTIQPLPVNNLQSEFSATGEITLRWSPKIDPLEPSAVPEKYIIYTRTEDNEFDNGVMVTQPEFTKTDLDSGVIYGFKVTAVNNGGESFPSEVISVCWLNNPNMALLINAFDRVSPPATINSGNFQGFADFIDMGVPDGYEISYTGRQFNFDATTPWKDDDAPGFGASYGDMETLIVPGNTFDFSYVHGSSLRAAGYGFVTVSDEVIAEAETILNKYPFVDLILGEEMEVSAPKSFYPNEFDAFPADLRNALARYLTQGGKLFLSGSYIGTELFRRNPVDSARIKFATDTLQYIWRTNHAARTGGLFAVDSTFNSYVSRTEFNTRYHPKIYQAEAPDAIEPADPTAKTLLRYHENNISAAVGFKGEYGVVAFGFPFETIISREDRDNMMQAILNYLEL